MKPIVDQLFTNKYWMKVEERAFHSIEDIEEIGILGVNTMDDAEKLLNSFRTVRTTIVDLAYYYDRGIKLQFVDKKDVAEIFNIINKHLNNWLTICNRHGYIHHIPPIEDFELLDNLAEKLYPFITSDSVLRKYVKEMGGLFGNVFNTNANGFYERYSPKLYEYCSMVHGEK